jgi:anti-sigma B factor antagonist
LWYFAPQLPCTERLSLAVPDAPARRPPEASGGNEGRLVMAESTPPISVSHYKDIRIVEFTNNRILDEANIKEIGDGLAGLIEEAGNPKLLLDFGTVDHLSSAALGMLINVNKKVKEQNGQLRLTNIKQQIYEVFVITKLNKLFRILPTRAEGLSSFNP